MLLFTALPATPSSAGQPVAPVNFDQTVYGDFAVIGNTVTTCPREPGQYPVRLCIDAQNRVGTGPSAQNNGYPMAWADVDADPGTFNSSSARLNIPAGARVAYAKLTWAGDTGSPKDIPCGRGPIRPPGSPAQQQVSLKVNDRGSLVGPDKYTEDPIAALANTDHQFYSAHADVTGHFRGMTGPSAVTVGNVWTPQGFDCFGGWSLTAVWMFDTPNPAAPARKQVAVYDTYSRVLTTKPGAQVRLPSIKSAGGLTRVGLAGFEGDWAVSGDQAMVNGHKLGGTGNFFVSAADGQLKPNSPNNMSVDARTVELPGDVFKPRETGVNMTFTSGLDAYLVAGVVLSSGRPELALATSVQPAVAHPGDQVTQSVTVTNTGSAPAVDVLVRMDIGTSCDQSIPRLEPGQGAKATCARPAPADDVQPSARATGTSLIGDQLSATASTSLEVVHPAIAVSKTATPGTVLSGQTVGYAIEVRNTGDTPLSGVAVDDKQVDACDKPDLGTLAAGERKSLQCSISAGEDGITNNVTVIGADKTGKKVAAGASAAFTVIHPRVEFTVRPSSRAARAGETVTFTVTVRNPTPIALGGVRVTGTPSACARDIGTLAPQQTVEYTCSVVMRERLTTSLTVTATPFINGQLAETRRDMVNLTSAVIVSLVEPTPEPPIVKKSAETSSSQNTPVAAFVAGLATISTFVTVGAISATARAKK
ncbi:hypothetical protein AOZ06_36060 [Kibdelosporangium phytohabitans]|uniref:DUF7507 domain-containing protein n=2 Tax=Kibdelosporangium phytohabitans TaxID=860235 RepID=A0A0N7F4J0_9PSEU|nr:hypothetical protein AOZ06_36060 [Kibdelosporangium phytohabitans]